MAVKHWLYLKTGLIRDPKHRARMGECIWLFAHMIDVADWETGICFDWKDRQEAEAMGMNLETLRHQRQKLEELDYIRATQKKHGQDIAIMDWINPRDYGAGVKNPRVQGGNETPPLENEDGNKGSNHGGNHVPSQIATPTLPSTSNESSIRERETPAPVYDFERMTQKEAYKVPTLALYRSAAQFFPGALLWPLVHGTIERHKLTYETIRAVSVEWLARGYKMDNVQGILDWCVNGIPARDRKRSGDTTRPLPRARVHSEQELQESQAEAAQVLGKH